MKIRFSSFERFSLRYKNSKDVFKLNPIDIVTLLNNYVGKRVQFEVRDWYGFTQKANFWVSNWEEEEMGFGSVYYTVTIECSRNISDNYYPTLLQIGKQLELAGPIGSQILRD